MEFKGNYTKLKIIPEGGTEQEVLHATDASVSISADPQDITAFGDTFTRNMVILKSWSGSFSAILALDGTSINIAPIWNTLLSSEAQLDVKIELYETPTGSPSVTISGTAVISGLDFDISHDSPIKVSIDLTGTGPLTIT